MSIPSPIQSQTPPLIISVVCLDNFRRHSQKRDGYSIPGDAGLEVYEWDWKSVLLVQRLGVRYVRELINRFCGLRARVAVVENSGQEHTGVSINRDTYGCHQRHGSLLSAASVMPAPNDLDHLMFKRVAILEFPMLAG